VLLGQAPAPQIGPEVAKRLRLADALKRIAEDLFDQVERECENTTIVVEPPAQVFP
jgi:hypothetical protein